MTAAGGEVTIQPQPTRKPMLRGINITSLNDGNENDVPAASAIQYFILEKKMNLVRVLIEWEKLQPQLLGPLNERLMSKIDAQVKSITTLGAKIQLQIFSFGRRKVDGVEYIVGKTDKVTAGHFADLWRKIAEHWKTNESVFLELQNEPHDQDTGTLMVVQNAAIAAIRETGAKNLIIVSGNDWSHPGWYASRKNRDSVASLRDPADKMAFTIHHYFDRGSAGENCDVEPVLTSRFDDFTQWARAAGKRAVVGEFATCSGDKERAAVTTFLNYIENNTDVFFGWAWWAGGGAWDQDSIYRLDPYASEWDHKNPDRNVSLGGTGRATMWARPMNDRPQMEYLRPFLNQ